MPGATRVALASFQNSLALPNDFLVLLPYNLLFPLTSGAWMPPAHHSTLGVTHNTEPHCETHYYCCYLLSVTGTALQVCLVCELPRTALDRLLRMPQTPLLFSGSF